MAIVLSTRLRCTCSYLKRSVGPNENLDPSGAGSGRILLKGSRCVMLCSRVQGTSQLQLSNGRFYGFNKPQNEPDTERPPEQRRDPTKRVNTTESTVRPPSTPDRSPCAPELGESESAGLDRACLGYRVPEKIGPVLSDLKLFEMKTQVGARKIVRRAMLAGVIQKFHIGAVLGVLGSDLFLRFEPG